MPEWPIYREERFRTPLATERAIGLWVDRIGSGTEGKRPSRLRILGQFAAVHVDEGAGEFHAPATGTVGVGPGQVMLLFPDEPNMYYSDRLWTTKWIVWNGPDAAVLERLGYLRKDRCILHDRTGAINRAFTRLSEIITSEDLTAVLERKNIILGMVLDLVRGMREAPHHRQSDDRMDQVVAFLTADYTRDLSIDGIARRFSLSPPHLRRLFKQYTGRGPREFLTALRISRAKELLSQGRPIKEVAGRVGYEDIFYFMRIFKKATGISPGKFT